MSANNRRPRYEFSQRALERACKVIPLGAQTFSKAYTQFPQGAAPHFLDRGIGGRVWDVDGNEYVDLINGLFPLVLGYCDPDVDAAIGQQLKKGISFSLATELETELAERLVEIIPCAEMVRFGKNGSDATTGCVRVARAATRRDVILVCGYHGWHDWYVGATVRNKGIPQTVSDLTVKVPYNDLEAVHDALGRHKGNVAALVMEPMNTTEPYPGYFEELFELVRSAGALVIFDEVITGFRFALGGAQQYFGITPDLAAFGKAMGNGMPISAIVGRADLMTEMEEIFFSSTFGGEALSIAAAIAVIDKMRREPVVERLWQTGRELATRVQTKIDHHNLGDTVGLVGADPWKIVSFKDHAKARQQAIKTLFLSEMLANGILLGGSHNVCFAHTEADLELVEGAYDKALDRISRELEGNSLEENLKLPVIMPVFSVR